jgi:hypothetical protein
VKAGEVLHCGEFECNSGANIFPIAKGNCLCDVREMTRFSFFVLTIFADFRFILICFFLTETKESTQSVESKGKVKNGTRRAEGQGIDRSGKNAVGQNREKRT